MRSVIPIVKPCTHCEEEAFAAASDQGGLAPFEQVLNAPSRRGDEGERRDPYAEPAPAHVTTNCCAVCGT
jgi:hypothetical protein